MANYYSAARTNYVEIEDMEGLAEALEPFSDVMICQEPSHPNIVCFLGSDESGWPTADEDGVEFDPFVQITPFMKPDQVLVLIETGHDRLRYVSGYAMACHSDGRAVTLDLSDIYQLAATTFSVPLCQISIAEF